MIIVADGKPQFIPEKHVPLWLSLKHLAVAIHSIDVQSSEVACRAINVGIAIINHPPNHHTWVV